jgi:hypothetical protein
VRSTASRIATTRTATGQTHAGDWVQVSRLGNPLVNEVVIPVGIKDVFNGLEPTGDAAALSFVTNPLLPPLMQALFGVQTPPTPRNDLVTIFLTGIPGLNQIGTSPKASEMLRSTPEFHHRASSSSGHRRRSAGTERPPLGTTWWISLAGDGRRDSTDACVRSRAQQPARRRRRRQRQVIPVGFPF